MIITPKYTSASNFYKDMAVVAVKNEDNPYRIINTDGEVVLVLKDIKVSKRTW